VRLAVVLLCSGACASARLDDAAPDGATPVPVDAAQAPEDAPEPDAPPVSSATGKLVITEVVLAPTAGEYIELANPTAQAIDLSDYYLSDSGAYFRLPAGPPTVDTSDFLVRFPAGATIPAGGVVTVAIDTAANFQTTYGLPPTFSIGSGTMLAIASNGTPTLTNSGEPVVLLHWSGEDLVRDVDLVIVGVPTAANQLPDKSGLAFDGPDPDTMATAYAADARTMQPQASTPGAGQSTKRIALDAGHQLQHGAGNGITGDDETSEDTRVTWDATFTAPTPGTLPTGLLP
jgi:uncharacterized protein